MYSHNPVLANPGNYSPRGSQSLDELNLDIPFHVGEKKIPHSTLEDPEERTSVILQNPMLKTKHCPTSMCSIAVYTISTLLKIDYWFTAKCI